MDKNINIKVKVWRQRGPEVKGAFETYDLQNISQGSSFLEMLDILNEQLVREGKEPVVFDHDCREGICGMCSLYINGHPHGPDDSITTCQLHMRRFNDGDTITIEPWRSAGFPIIRDLMVDRSAYDKIIQAGGFVSVNTGGVPDANAIPIPKANADMAMDAAACIGCGACAAACRTARLCSSSLLRSASWLSSHRAVSKLPAVLRLWSLRWMSWASVTVRTLVLAKSNAPRTSRSPISLV